MSDPATRLVQPLPAGTGFSRFLRCLVAGRGSLADSLEFATTMRSTPQVAAAFEYMTKAAQTAGTVADAAWAGPLALSGLANEALSLVRARSVLGQLNDTVRHVPFNVKFPRDTSAVTLGGWVAENVPAPVAQLSFDSLGPVSVAKIAVIVALSRELLVTGTPATEAIVRDSVLGGLAAQIDRSFLDPTSGAIAGRPAAITSGAPSVTSTGTTAAQMTADLTAMISAIQTNGASLVWILRPTTLAKIAGTLGAAGNLAVADVPRTLYGLPILANANSPQQIVLLDAQAVLLADENGFDLSLSENASVQMESAPDSPVLATTILTSLFQINAVGIRATRILSWLRGHAGAVVYMTVSY